MERYFSFSGGGFNTHSLLAGMISGCLDALENSGRIRDVGLLTKSAAGFSANSGGSWFLSQLSYSQKFLNQFETEQLAGNYNSTGYNGQISDIFQGISTSAKSSSYSEIVNSLQSGSDSLSATSLIDSWFSMLDESGFNWRAFNQQITFKPFSMAPLMSSISFDAERLSWSSGKDFVVSTSLQAKPVVLDSIGIFANKIFSQAVSEAVDSAAQTIPLSLVSVAQDASSSSAYRAAAFLPAGSNALKYSTNAWMGAPNPKQIDLSSTIDASQLSVFDVATASSSAVGLLAAPASYAGIFGATTASTLSPLVNQLSYELSDLAPPAMFQDGVMLMPGEVPTGSSLSTQFNSLSSDLTTRLADGAYVDNTSAAYMVKHIQSEQAIDDPFYLTVFSNSTTSPEKGISMPGAGQNQPFTVTSDVAALFGNSDGTGNDGSVVINTTMGNQTTPSPQVFAPDAWHGVEPLWTYESGAIDIALYRLSVETVDNKAFDVKAGQSGTVDVYVSRNSSSAPAPHETSNLTAYAQNYDVFRKAVNSGGFDYLSDSFGVVSNQVQPYADASKSELLSAAISVDTNDRTVKRLSRFRGVQNQSDRDSTIIRGSDTHDVILHPKTKAIVHGGEGSDLHLINHAARSLSGKSKISNSVIVDFEQGDKIIFRRRHFGREITFEHATNRRQKRRFQESEADFVFFDRGAQIGADPGLSSQLFFNANGSQPGWGSEGGLFINFRNGFDLSLSHMASF